MLLLRQASGATAACVSCGLRHHRHRDLATMSPRRRPSRRDGVILPEEPSAPAGERAQVDPLENLRPPEQLDTFVDSRTKRTIGLKVCHQLVCGAVIRIED